MDDDSTGKGPARHADGRFGPGNPGRPLGSRNRMSKRIALGLLQHYAENEAEILSRLSQYHFADYVRLIGRMLPRAPAEGSPDLESMPPQDVAHVLAEVRGVMERIEAGQGTLVEIEAALAGIPFPGEGTAAPGPDAQGRGTVIYDPNTGAPRVIVRTVQARDVY